MTALLFASLLAAQSPATSIKVVVEGLPNGALPEVKVKIPSGQEEAVDLAKGWQGSAVGNYEVNAPSFRYAHPVVDTVFDAPTVKRTVKSGETVTISVRYGPRSASGGLFTFTDRIDADTDDFTVGEIRFLSAAELLKGGFTTATKIIKTAARAYAGAALPDGAVFFAGGWDLPGVHRVGSAQFSTGAKSVVLPGGESAFMALDSKGQVWLHNSDWAKCYGPYSAGMSFAGAPKVSLTQVPDAEEPISFDHLLFDSEGGMVIIGRGGIVRLKPSELNSSKNVPLSGIQINTGSLYQAALDEEGNLWVCDENSVVHKFAKSGDGFSSDSTQFTVPQASVGLAIDNSGSVWVLNRYTGEMHVLEKGSSEFKLKGVYGKGHASGSRLVFNPPPAWSPLSAAQDFVKVRFQAAE